MASKIVGANSEIDFDDESGPMRRLARQTTNDSVNGALKRLREADRRLMEMLMDTDRPDYASISRRTERPLGSIGPTRQRILSRLRRDLRQETATALAARVANCTPDHVARAAASGVMI